MVNQELLEANGNIQVLQRGKMALSLSGMIRSIILIAAISLLLTLFIGPMRSASAESPTFVRVVNASPDASVTSIFVDGKEIVHNFQFGTVTAYVTIPAGNHRWQMAAIGKGPGASSMSEMVRCDPGVAYTIFSYGTQKTGIKLGMFMDDNALATGSAKVRVYHLASQTGSVDVSANTTSLVNGLTYPNASSYVLLPSGAYTFHMAGATSSSVSSTMPSGTIESIFLINKSSGNQVQVVTAQEKGLPTLPNTGSDPYATDGTVSRHLLPIGGLALVVIILSGLIFFGSSRRSRSKRG
jgi:hypothetical protein